MPLVRTNINSVRVSPAGQRVVVLSDQLGKRYLPIWLEHSEADAILEVLKSTDSPKLTTHDLLCQVIGAFSAKLNMAIIHDVSFIKDHLLFVAKVTLATGDKSVDIECRPSDAIALAVTSESPILVEESVMAKAGISGNLEPEEACDNQRAIVDQGPQEPSKTYKSSELTQLTYVKRPRKIELTGQEVEMAVTNVTVGALMGLHPGIVMLSDKEGNWRLPIWVTPSQADTILKLINKVAHSQTHDLLCRVSEIFSSKVSMALIDQLQENVFRTQLVFETGDRRFGIDCRASDAIATAVVARAPILARESVLQKAGTSRTQRDKDTANRRRIESLVAVMKAPSWKFWVTKEKKAKAADTLADMSTNGADPKVREAAAEAIEETRGQSRPKCG